MQGNIGGQIGGYSEAQRKEDNERSMRYTVLQLATKASADGNEVIRIAEKYYAFLKGVDTSSLSG